MKRKRQVPFDYLEDEIRGLTLFPNSPYARLEPRLGTYAAQRRCYIENGLYGAAPPRPFQKLRRLRRYFHKLQAILLRLSGRHSAGRRNARELHLETPEILLPKLDPALDGLKILHLADFHLDLNPGVVERTMFLIESVDFDLAVHTGDFFDMAPKPTGAQIQDYEHLLAAVDGELFAVPGNHDTLAAIEALESIGIRFLLNESVEIERRGARILIAGVEDPHFFAGDDWSAFENLRERDLSLRLLLAHSPEGFAEAQSAGFDLQLSGHTHGGQICWPGGRPIIANCHTPRDLLSGTWEAGNLRGYTSRGAGSGQYPVRFNCPPEITRITIRSNSGNSLTL